MTQKVNLIPEEWFKLIADPVIREKALANVRNPELTQRCVLNETYESIDDALLFGFGWKNSPEGRAYWDEIHKNHIHLIQHPTETEAQKAKDRELLEEFELWHHNNYGASTITTEKIEDFLTEKYKP